MHTKLEHTLTHTFHKHVMEVNSYIIHITHFRHRNVERISEFLTKAFKRPMKELLFTLFEFNA